MSGALRVVSNMLVLALLLASTAAMAKEDAAFSNAPSECEAVTAILAASAADEPFAGWEATPVCEIRAPHTIKLRFVDADASLTMHLARLGEAPAKGISHTTLFDIMIGGKDIDFDDPRVQGLVAAVTTALDAHGDALVEHLDAMIAGATADESSPPDDDGALGMVPPWLGRLWLALMLLGAVTTAFALPRRPTMATRALPSRLPPPRRCLVLLGGAVTLGVVLRAAVGMYEPLFMLKDYTSTDAASLLFDTGSSSLFHTPLMGWLQSVVRLVDPGTYHTTTSFRPLHVVISLVGIVAVHRALTAMTGRWQLGIAAAYLVASSPVDIDLCVRNHPYFVTQTALYVAWALGARLSARPSRSRVLALAVAMALAVWSNVLALLGVGGLLLVLWFQRGLPRRSFGRLLLTTGLLCVPLVFMLGRGALRYLFIASDIASSTAANALVMRLAEALFVLLPLAVLTYGLLTTRGGPPLRKLATAGAVIPLAVAGALAVWFIDLAPHYWGPPPPNLETSEAQVAASVETSFVQEKSFAASEPLRFVPAFNPPTILTGHHFLTYFSVWRGMELYEPLHAVAPWIVLLASALVIALVGRRHVPLLLAHLLGLGGAFFLHELMFVRYVNLAFVAVTGLLVAVVSLERVESPWIVGALTTLLVGLQLVYLPTVLTPLPMA